MTDMFGDNGAVLSPDGLYRYRLDRAVANSGPVYAFIGVNPSTADASINDATVRKWVGFVTSWGGSRFIVGNVFAFRSTNVRALRSAADPVGPENQNYLTQIAAESDVIVACWGDRKKLSPALRPACGLVVDLLESSGKPLMCFGRTAGGDPLHPLFLGYRTNLTPLREVGDG